jgi:GTP diphosphokinase / guanosine-3',5'-bis(diphosphate) 3'-diphosphatase
MPDRTGRDVRVTAEYSAGWSLERKREYFDGAKSVIDRVRGANPRLEKRFDQLYGRRP